VLKGHINLAKIKFKKGCSGQNLDVLARMHLWQHLEDYPHSTGHGVGNFLNVHEGPEAINLSNNVVLQPGMVLSNEPGYYKPGAFGIRIENLMYVKETINSNFLEFEALTLVPYCAKLIDHTLLDDDEKAWLANYYVTIKDKIYNLLSKNAQSWLERELCAINS
jgi:Xaa-Pro aminopeptidase